MFALPRRITDAAGNAISHGGLRQDNSRANRNNLDSGAGEGQFCNICLTNLGGMGHEQVTSHIVNCTTGLSSRASSSSSASDPVFVLGSRESSPQQSPQQSPQHPPQPPPQQAQQPPQQPPQQQLEDSSIQSLSGLMMSIPSFVSGKIAESNFSPTTKSGKRQKVKDLKASCRKAVQSILNPAATDHEKCKNEAIFARGLLAESKVNEIYEFITDFDDEILPEAED